ncbi:MAG: hypothetical protein HY077_05975 [Elusimicrobia bacterium]|nr:hypothetical protein [Elusimicrobiota bacterium]
MKTLIFLLSLAVGASAAELPGMSRDAAKPEAKQAPAAPTTVGGDTDVTIKATDSSKLGVMKPALNIDLDPFETLRPQLAPDQSLLLAVSPLTVSWRRTHPDFLHNERVIQPWRTTFSARPGIAFRVRDQLQDVMQRKMEPKEAKSYAWSLTIADEEGRVFHHYEGSNDPPEELVWTGQNEQGEWIHAGRSYSAVYSFTDSGGSPRTSVGKPLLFRGIVHQEDTGMHVSLDSSVLFGTSKNATELAKPSGVGLMRSAADLIKRKFTGIPVAVRVFASTKELGDAQAASIQAYLLKELMTGLKNVSTDAARAAFSDQRVEVVLLNR